MGCNCGKNRQTPEQRDAARRAAATSATPTQRQPSPPQRDPATPAAPPHVSAPYGTTQQFALELPGGETRRFGSRLEAEAALVRSGRRGSVHPL